MRGEEKECCQETATDAPNLKHAENAIAKLAEAKKYTAPTAQPIW